MPSRALAASGLPTAAPELSQGTEPPQTTPEAYGSCPRGILIFPGAQILGEYALAICSPSRGQSSVRVIHPLAFRSKFMPDEERGIRRGRCAGIGGIGLRGGKYC